METRHQEASPSRPITVVEQGMHDRLMFDLFLERQKPQVASAEEVFEDILSALSKEYAWIGSEDESQRGQVLAAIDDIRYYQKQTHTETGNYPTGRETYIAFRRKIETTDDYADHAPTTVLLIEALMDGDLRTGDVPVLWYNSRSNTR